MAGKTDNKKGRKYWHFFLNVYKKIDMYVCMSIFFKMIANCA